MKDFAWAFRWLRKNPLFAAAVIAILGLGAGANTAVFSIVDAVLLRPLPYQHADRLVRIDGSSARLLVTGVSAADYLRWHDRRDLFDAAVAYTKEWITVTGGKEPDQVMALRTGGGLFALLGAQAWLGRTLLDLDDNPGAPKVAVLSDRLWRRLFDGDARVIGRTMRVGDDAVTVVGVMPQDFEFAYSNVEMWLPLRLTPAATGLLQVVARTKAGVTIPQAQAAMQIVARQLEAEDPLKRAGLRFEVSPWRETTDVKYERTLIFILAAVGLVLLIACADVGSLLLTRAVQRQKEIAIRASLGAGFWWVLRQLLAESLVVAVVASAAGMALAFYGLKLLRIELARLPIVLPHLQRAGLNGRVLAFELGLCFLLAILCGIAPVLAATKPDLQAVLRTGQAGKAKRSPRLFSILIAYETAFAFLLLVGSGLMIRSLIRLQQEDHGFRPDHVLTLRVPIGSLTQPRPTGKYETKPQQMAFYKSLLDRLQSIPGLDAVAVVNNLPLSGISSSTPVQGPDGKPMLVSTRTISPQYFAAMGIPLLAGRTFSDEDRTGSRNVAIINQYLARQLFGERDPVGLALPLGEAGAPAITIVGVATDSAQLNYDQPAKGEVYRPYQQFIFATFMSTIVVRTAGDPEALTNVLRKQIWAVDANQPVVKVETMNDVIADSIWRPRFSAWMLSVLGGLALVLTAAGMYGVIAYTTALRTREVGIRIALGATPYQVVGLILRGAMIPVAIGLAASAAATLLLTRLLSSLLYGVAPNDPLAYLSAAAVLLGTTVAASALPAWQAATGDPCRALNSE